MSRHLSSMSPIQNFDLEFVTFHLVKVFVLFITNFIEKCSITWVSTFKYSALDLEWHECNLWRSVSSSPERLLILGRQLGESHAWLMYLIRAHICT